MTRNRKDRQKEAGFTLIEIIAVLVILGILAVVAVPKYFDMQNQSRLQAARGLVAAAQSQLSLGYANSKLNTSYTFSFNTECNTVKNTISNSGETTSLTCSGTTNSVSIAANVGNQQATATWTNPDSQ